MPDAKAKPLRAFKNNISLILLAENWNELKAVCNIDNELAEQFRLDMQKGWHEVNRIWAGAMTYCKWKREGRM